MNRRPRLTGSDLVTALERGFTVILSHADGRRTVVPVHSGETIGVGLLLKILRDCEISSANLEELLEF